MFDKIGKFSSRFRYPIIAAWGALLAVVLVLAPSMSDVVTSDQSSYLPVDEPSVVAAQIAREYFPDQASPSQAVLVVESQSGSIHDAPQQAYLEALTRWIEQDLPADIVGTVLSPVDPALSERLISADGQAAMIFVGLSGSIEDPATLETLEQMQARLDTAPEQMAGYVTGSVAIVDEYKSSALESADRTTIITIVLVITILLIIYRSPVTPIVPLATIGVAFLVSRGLVAWLTNVGLTVSSITEVFMVVLLFGAGTDYCLFLVSRFREYMADDASGPQGARRTVDRVGETITSSAGTVIVGMIAMSFAEMSLFADTGPALAIGVAVALLAGLTLTPALLAILDKYAFWPGGARHAVHAGVWGKLARWVTSRPWVPLALALVILVPLSIYGQGMARNFDLLSDLPEDAPSKVGFRILAEHFGAGEMQPLDIVMVDIPDARSPEGMAYVDDLTERLLDTEGVADVRSLTLPAGRSSPELGESLRVDAQLALMVDMIDELRNQTGDPAALADLDLDEATAGLDMLHTYLDDLAVAFPELVDHPDYQAALAALDGLETALAEGQQRLLVSNQLDEAAAGISGALAGAGTDSGDLSQMQDARAQFDTLRAYLVGLADAHPTVATLDGYDDALATLDQLDTTLNEIDRALLVSTQLDLVAQSIERAAGALDDPAAVAGLAATVGDPGAEAAGDLAALGQLDVYLRELATAHPLLAQQPEFAAASQHLAAVQEMAGQMGQARLLGNQLALVASEMDATVQALDENPLALLPQSGEPGAAEQMGVLHSYLEEVGMAYPSLAATDDYQTAISTTLAMSRSMETINLAQVNQLISQSKASLVTLSAAFGGMATTAADTLPQATFVPQNLPGEMGALVPDLAPLAREMAAAGAELSDLSQFARQEMPDAAFVPETTLPTSDTIEDPLPALEAGLDDLAGALERLARAAGTEMPAVTYQPPGELMAGDVAADATGAVLAEVDTLQAALDALSAGFATQEAGFFIPDALAEDAGPEIDQLLNTYSTEGGDAARLQVVLDSDPFSPEAMDTVALLREEVANASSGYISGSTATNLDLRDVMDRDFVR
ncbi:MAG: MMPL family transporter, partial [Anaerolineae bacterium]